MKQLVWLLAATVMFAGCTGGDEGPTTPACDETMNYIDAEGVCTPHVEPTMIVSGLPDTVAQFTPVEFAWALDNGTRMAVHSMDSRILVSNEDMAVTNTTGPDDWGTQVVKETHKDFPQNFTSTFVWDEVETLYVKGYMLINAVNVWVDLGTIDVAAVTATGNRTTIEISGTPPAVDANEVAITVGDGVTFDNQLSYEVTLSWTCTNGVTPADGAIAAGASKNVDFTTLTSCTYTLNSPLAASGQDPLAISGKKVIVGRP